MNKVLLTAILLLSLVLSCGIQTLAAETTLTDKGRSDVNVYAKSIENTVWETVEPSDGKGQITLRDGTEIKVENIKDDGLKLVIYAIPKSDTEAYAWIETIFDGTVEGVLPYYIYLENTEGDRFPADDITVTIKMSYPATDPVAYSLNSDGTSVNLNGTADDNAVTFVSDGSPFYVLGETCIGSGADPDAPPTGDFVLPALSLLAVAAGCALFVSKRSHKHA